MGALIAKVDGKFSETTIDDETVVMNLESGDFFSLVGTARAVWLLIDGTRDTDALIATLAEEFGTGHEVIADDVTGFVTELRDAGLIRRD